MRLTDKMPLRRALFYIFLSVTLVSGSASVAVGYHLQSKWRRLHDHIHAIREPIACLYDCRNGAIDNTGTLIPFHGGQRLPWLYMGLGADVPLAWGEQIGDARIPLALTLLNHLKGDAVTLVDLSRAALPSKGRRLVAVDWCGIRLLLNPDDIDTEMRQLKQLQKKYLATSGKKPESIDFRLPNLAYIKERS